MYVSSQQPQNCIRRKQYYNCLLKSAILLIIFHTQPFHGLLRFTEHRYSYKVKYTLLQNKTAILQNCYSSLSHNFAEIYCINSWNGNSCYTAHSVYGKWKSMCFKVFMIILDKVNVHEHRQSKDALTVPGCSGSNDLHIPIPSRHKHTS